LITLDKLNTEIERRMKELREITAILEDDGEIEYIEDYL
jgi:hypothetical protein